MQKTELAALDEFIHHLREVFFSLRGLSDQLHAQFDLSASDRGLLQELELRGPLTVPTLAQSRSVSRQAMQKSVDQLIERKWLITQANPRHHRSSLVAVTDEGRRVFTQLRAREAAVFSGLALPIPLARLQRTTTTLAELTHFFATLELNKGAGR